MQLVMVYVMEQLQLEALVLLLVIRILGTQHLHKTLHRLPVYVPEHIYALLPI